MMSHFLRKAHKNLSLLLGSSIHRFDRIPTIERKGLTKKRVLELKSKYGTQLKEMMKRSRDERREYGRMLCTESWVVSDRFMRGEGNVYLGPIVRGEPYKIAVHNCKNHIREVGTIHSHWAIDFFSPEDLMTAVRREELTCLLFQRNGETYLRCVSPILAWQYPVRTRLWIYGGLVDVSRAFKEALRLSKKYGDEWQPYTQGLIRYEDMSPEARRAYDEYQYHVSLINTVQPAVEKLLNGVEMRL